MGPQGRSGLGGKSRPHREYFIVLICSHVFCRHNRAHYPPTRLTFGHKHKERRYGYLLNDAAGLGVLVCSLGLAFLVNLTIPVHFLGLGTTSRGLPLNGPVPFGIVSNNHHAVSCTKMSRLTSDPDNEFFG